MYIYISHITKNCWAQEWRQNIFWEIFKIKNKECPERPNTRAKAHPQFGTLVSVIFYVL
jgi:hypothetical protein